MVTLQKLAQDSLMRHHQSRLSRRIAIESQPPLPHPPFHKPPYYACVVLVMVAVAAGMGRMAEHDELLRRGFGGVEREDHACRHIVVVAAVDKEHGLVALDRKSVV